MLMARSRPFLIVVLGALLVAIATPLLLLKVWRVTPSGFRPLVRVSMLDRLQAWSLERNARAAEARGDFENASLAWRAAAANIPVDYTALRNGLVIIPRLRSPTESASTALTMGSWLIQLGHTNAADLELIAKVWNRCQLYERTADIPSYVTNFQSSATLNRLLAVAYFQSSRYSAFQKLLAEDNALAEEVNRATDAAGAPLGGNESDTDFRAVSLAYLAIAGAADQRTTALRLLQEMEQDSKSEALAYELEMAVYLRLRDLKGMERVYKHLVEMGQAGVWHLTAYCTLLAIEGDKDQAVALARRANLSPKTDNDAMRLISTFTALEMYDEAEQLCRRYFSAPPWVQEGALMRSDLLMRMKRWDDLRLLAFQIRRYPDVMSTLGGFSSFIEGMAELAQGYTENAERAFQKAVDEGFRNPRLALQVAKSLLDVNTSVLKELKADRSRSPFIPAKYAEPILLPNHQMRKELDNEPVYLNLLVQCAYYLHKSDYLMDAVTRLYALTPKDPVVMNNYAATLLLFRKKPAEAVSLTLQVLQAYPNSRDALLNHITALTMNDRLDDAEQLLIHFPTDRMDNATAAQYHIMLFELRLKQGRMAEARSELRAIDTAQLFPVQVAWLEETEPQLEAASTAKPTTP